jgi:hypothetical protein
MNHLRVGENTEKLIFKIKHLCPEHLETSQNTIIRKQ